MSVKKDPSGRRSVEAEVELTGTPEEVWQAIATGAGISAWFVPSEVEERAGGRAVSHFGPGDSMDSVGTIGAWEPPHRYTVETQEGPGPIATEWTVTAKSGGTCTVRVVHSWFSSSDDWDKQFEGHQEGWQAMFRTLRLYLARFRGMTGGSIPLMGVVKQPKAEAWLALTAALGIGPTAPGQQLTISGEVPPLSGVVERVGADGHLHELMLSLDAPAPGIAHFACAAQAGDQVFVVIRLYFYGERAAATVARDAPRWQAWMQQCFPFAPKD